MKMIIEIEMNNDAFCEYPMMEVERILNKLTHNLKDVLYPLDHFPRVLFDYNGNRVGIAKFVKEH